MIHHLTVQITARAGGPAYGVRMHHKHNQQAMLTSRYSFLSIALTPGSLTSKVAQRKDVSKQQMINAPASIQNATERHDIPSGLRHPPFARVWPEASRPSCEEFPGIATTTVTQSTSPISEATHSATRTPSLTRTDSPACMSGGFWNEKLRYVSFGICTRT